MVPKIRNAPIPVIDLFAGPGGLNEGFSQLGEREGTPRFRTVGSFEMELSAVRTLQLRSTYRALLRQGQVPGAYYQYIRGEISHAEFTTHDEVRVAWEREKAHVHQVELGAEDDPSEELIREGLADAGVNSPQDAWVLIGGPPCQAYSLAGRSRRANDASFASDKKHLLYREYLRIIRTFSPPVFVMENVKGLLSSKAEVGGMFDQIMGDLRGASGEGSYEIYSLVSATRPEDLKPSDFVIRAERYGIPQRRHRVILVGIRKDFAQLAAGPRQLTESPAVSVGEALLGMPPVRSGISRPSNDDIGEWLDVRNGALRHLNEKWVGSVPASRGGAAVEVLQHPKGTFGDWVRDPNLHHVVQHRARSHMKSDLERYWYAAARAQVDKVSPKLREFPKPLQPAHKNASSDSHPFEDRFRVQLESSPATTVVSHISKDGHYYIHFDPAQMRSLTVREAARLQTFPDNYFFEGNRTQQYHQVGNAVPPLLAYQIAVVIDDLLRGAGS